MNNNCNDNILSQIDFYKNKNCCSRFCYGPTGPTGPSGEVVITYGGLYNNQTQIPVFTTVNTYVQLTLNTPLPSNNVITNSNNTITIQESGNYEINYNVLLNTNKQVDIGIAVRNNGTVIPNTRGTQTMSVDTTTSISYDARLSANTIVTLQAGDIIDLAIQVINTLPNELNAIINGNANATLTIRKLN